jgi:purine-binding chemotaxis protein CheW
MIDATQYLTFQIHGRWYGCDLLWVREILRRPVLTPVDLAPPTIRGLVHLRGQILTALDLETRLGLGPGTTPPTERCVVFKTAPEIARLAAPPSDADQAGPDLVGVLVDAIGDIVTNSEPPLPPPPEALSGISADCVSGILNREGKLITLLRLGSVLAPPVHA